MTTDTEIQPSSKFHNYVNRMLDRPTVCPSCYAKPDTRAGEHVYLCPTETCLVVSFAGPRIEGVPS